MHTERSDHLEWEPTFFYSPTMYYALLSAPKGSNKYTLTIKLFVLQNANNLHCNFVKMLLSYPCFSLESYKLLLPTNYSHCYRLPHIYSFSTTRNSYVKCTALIISWTSTCHSEQDAPREKPKLSWRTLGGSSSSCTFCQF